ncbi:unnamed protein product [Prunus brigantina]
MRRRAASKMVQRELDEQLGIAMALLKEENQSRRGSREGRGPNVDRHRHSRGKNLLENYFIPQSLYSNKNAAGNLGLLPEQKFTSVIRMLAYGSSSDQMDEIARMGKSTVLESLVRFCDAVETLYTGTTCADLRPGTCNSFYKKLSLEDFLE